MRGKSVVVIAGIIVIIAVTFGLYASGVDDQVIDSGEGVSSDMARIVIKSDSGWSADIKDSQSRSQLVNGFGDRTIPIICNNDGQYSITVQKSDAESGTLNVEVRSEEHTSELQSRQYLVCR